MKIFTQNQSNSTIGLFKYMVATVIVLFSLLPFVTAHAAGSLEVLNIKQTSANLKAAGLTPAKIYKIVVFTSNVTPREYQFYADLNGGGERDFESLSPDTSYSAFVAEYNPDTDFLSKIHEAEIQFKTLSVPPANGQLIASSITSTSVTLKLTGVEPNTPHQFAGSAVNVAGDTFDIDFNSDNKGSFEKTLSNLTPDRNYKFYVFRYDSATSSYVAANVAPLDFKTLSIKSSDPIVLPNKDTGGDTTTPGNDDKDDYNSGGGGANNPDDKGGYESGGGGANNPTTGVQINTSIENPLKNGIDDIPSLIEAILNIVLVIGVPIVTLAIIYAGFLFVTARGNEEKLTTAKKTLMYTLIGATLLLGSFVIARAIKGTVDEINRTS